MYYQRLCFHTSTASLRLLYGSYSRSTVCNPFICNPTPSLNTMARLDLSMCTEISQQQALIGLCRTGKGCTEPARANLPVTPSCGASAVAGPAGAAPGALPKYHMHVGRMRGQHREWLAGRRRLSLHRRRLLLKVVFFLTQHPYYVLKSPFLIMVLLLPAAMP